MHRNGVFGSFGAPETPFRGRGALEATAPDLPERGFCLFCGGRGSPQSKRKRLEHAIWGGFRYVSEIGKNVDGAILAR